MNLLPNRWLNGSRSFNGARFPLTSALSLGEREKRSQLFGKAIVVNGSNAAQITESEQLLFPLPEGEGQGEGKGSILSPKRITISSRN
jgi:hypothetical protein